MTVCAIVRSFTWVMISDGNEAAQHPEPFTWSDFFPQFFLQLRELQSSFATRLAKGRVGIVLLLGVLSSGRMTTDLKRARLLSEQGSTQPSSTLSGGRRSPGVRPKQPNQRSAPNRQHPRPSGHA
jgi:hypothetical protein